MIKKVIKQLLPANFKRNFKEDLGVPSLHWSLENLKKCGFIPKQVFDIGAYEGYWTRDLLEVFPNAKVQMFEAQEAKRPILSAVKESLQNVDFEIQLLSSEDGQEVSFLESETASHVLRGNEAHENGVKGNIKKTKTLDTLVREKGIGLPNLMKLDVQGHELEVLRGGSQCLQHAEICLLEVSLLDLGDQSPLLLEVLKFMDEHGFQTYDLSGVMRRPFDKALHQIDLFFVKKNSALIASKRWD